MGRVLTIDKIPELTLDKLPELFSPAEYIQNFLKSQTVKARTKPKFFNALKEILLNENGQKSLLFSFWLVFCLSFRENTNQITSQIIRNIRGLNKDLVLRMMNYKNREEVLLHYEFSLAYLVHFIMFHLFKQDDEKVTHPRFILNCYHIVIYERRGLLVSDYYIEQQIESIFHTNSFVYLNKEIRIQEKLREDASRSLWDGVTSASAKPKKIFEFGKKNGSCSLKKRPLR
jgi:hypothetical protein